MRRSLRAKWMMQTLVENRGEILLLQRSIRAALSRWATKEEVAKCDKEQVIAPHALSVLSPAEGEAEHVEERMFITQSAVNRCLEIEFSVNPRLLQYFVCLGERSVVKKMKEVEPVEVYKCIDREDVYGYYVCEGDNAYAIV